MFSQNKATCSIAWWSRYSVKLPWKYFLAPLSVLTFHFSNCACTWQTIYNTLQGLVLSKQVCKRKGSYSFAYITWLMHSLPHFLPISFIYVYIFSSQTTWLGPCFLQVSWQTSHHIIMYPPIHHIPLIIFLQLATLHYQLLMFFLSIEKVSSHYQLPPFFLGQMKVTNIAHNLTVLMTIFTNSCMQQFMHD